MKHHHAAPDGCPPQERLRAPDGRLNPGWRSTFGAAAALSVGASTTTVLCFGVFVPYLHRAFGWGFGAIALAATLISIAVMVASPIQGMLVDRLGARRIILVSIPLYGAGYAMLSQLSGDIRQFYLLWVLVPLLGFGVWPSGYIKVVSGWFEQRLGLAIGVANVGIGVGAVLLPALIGATAAHFGWRAAYVVIGVLSVVVAWPCAWYFVHERARPATQHDRAAGAAVAPGLTLAQAWLDASFWKIALAFLLLGGCSTAVLVNQVAILVDNGSSIAVAVTLQSVVGVATLVARLAIGWLLDRVPVKLVMPVLALCGAGAMLLYAGGASGLSAAPCAVFIGVMVGAEFSVLGYALRRYCGPRALGSLFGSVFAVFQLGAAGGTAAIGYLRSETGSWSQALYGLAAATVVTAILFGVLGCYRYAPLQGSATDDMANHDGAGAGALGAADSR
ncbi:MFS transporter [Paraburkholderia sp. J12]|uniref:MFS transporter n=1 Tax=Paraburkholderia sp. J12 TaxID=2805432 RepID=UPI002ABD6E7B|nr:MFS transporter [Paraburkholderia sp. J12]